MDHTFLRVRELDARIDECIDPAQRTALSEERAALWASFRTVTLDTPLSAITGLQYARMEVVDCLRECPSDDMRARLLGVDHVLKRLLHDARKVPVAVTLLSQRPALKKKKRPRAVQQPVTSIDTEEEEESDGE